MSRTETHRKVIKIFGLTIYDNEYKITIEEHDKPLVSAFSDALSQSTLNGWQELSGAKAEEKLRIAK